MMKVSGMIVNESSLSYLESKAVKENELVKKVEEKDLKIKTLEETIDDIRAQHIEQIHQKDTQIVELEESKKSTLSENESMRLKLMAYKQKKRELKNVRIINMQQISELLKINREVQSESATAMQEIKQERRVSYFQMLTSAITTVACMVTMYYGIKYSIPAMILRLGRNVPPAT